jgi:hypothetical protein
MATFTSALSGKQLYGSKHSGMRSRAVMPGVYASCSPMR